MSILVNEIRPFWLQGLNEIVGQQKNSFVSWLLKKEYCIYLPISQSNFTLDIVSNQYCQNLLSGFAFDCNRMASAAFETMYIIEQNRKLPKSTSWLIIKSYYAAFFAAHSIIRMLGISCSQLRKHQASEIVEVAKLFENDNGKTISSSYYSCIYNQSENQLLFENIKSKGGTHESFWQIFLKSIKDLSTSILSSGKIVLQSQQVSTKLDELCRILCYEGHNGGNWLSSVKNQVNYRHELSAWFPYSRKRQQSVDAAYSNSEMWVNDPMNISLLVNYSNPINMFLNACSFIVGLCRELIQDMSSRCSRGKSYLKDGAIRLLHQCSENY